MRIETDYKYRVTVTVTIDCGALEVEADTPEQAALIAEEEAWTLIAVGGGDATVTIDNTEEIDTWT